MNASIENISNLLELIIEEMENTSNPRDFDIEHFFLKNGCNANLAQRLEDFLPAACARIFCQELGIITSDYYRRYITKGNYGVPLRYDDDPIWETLLNYAQRLSVDSLNRTKFASLVQHSAEYSTINKALNDGMTMADLKGAKFSPNLYLAPL